MARLLFVHFLYAFFLYLYFVRNFLYLCDIIRFLTYGNDNSPFRKKAFASNGMARFWYFSHCIIADMVFQYLCIFQYWRWRFSCWILIRIIYSGYNDWGNFGPDGIGILNNRIGDRDKKLHQTMAWNMRNSVFLRKPVKCFCTILYQGIRLNYSRCNGRFRCINNRQAHILQFLIHVS